MQTRFEFSRSDLLPRVKDALDPSVRLHAIEPRDALRQLVYTVLAEGNAPSVAVALFNRVNTAYPTWPSLAAASGEALQKLLIGSANAQAKARDLPLILQGIEARCGDYDLAILAKMSTSSAVAWLSELPGVSEPVAASVLMFSSLKRAVFAVDSELSRPIRRLGLCEDGSPISALSRQMMELAPPSWGAEDFSSLELGLRKVARTVCREEVPLCDRCPLQAVCRNAGHSANIVRFPVERLAARRAAREATETAMERIKPTSPMPDQSET